MKRSLVLMAMVLFTAPSVFASGSTDFLCAAQKSNIRFDYHEGEDVTASLSRVVGLDKHQLREVLLKGNPLTLEPYDIESLLKLGDSISVNGCTKQLAPNTDGLDAQEYASCMDKKDAADIQTTYNDEVDQYKNKYNHILQTVTLKDSAKIVLDIRDWNASSDQEGQYHGTLKVVGSTGSYTDLSLNVNCSVSFP